LLNACKKFVAIPASPQLITTAGVFSNDQTAISAVDGVYTAIRAGTPSFENGSVSILTSLSADDIYNTASNPNYDPYFNNAIPSNNGNIANLWGNAYNIIYRTNAIIDGLQASAALSDSIKTQLTGEMKVVRAMSYFYLVNLFGDVPLITTPDYQVSSQIGRTPLVRVYQQMVTDLTAAQSLLTSSYPSPNKARPNKQTATALLARVHLYQGDWTGAEASASSVIGSGVYQMVADLNQVFLKNSNEIIWEMASPSETKPAVEAAIFIPASATSRPAFSATSYLMNAFEPGDQRTANWLKAVTISKIKYYYPYKYKNRATTNITEYEVVLRLAEQYLIRAEAEAHGAGQGINGAINDLNMIRARAGLQAYNGQPRQDAVIQAIFNERQVELFTEWGNRWFDLRRVGTINAVLGAEKPGWKIADALYPIPYNQLLYNPKLTQNDSY